MKFLFLVLLVPIFFSISTKAQCHWKNVDSLTYETAGAASTIDTGINAAEVYHTTPQTYGAKTGSYGLYFNMQNTAPIGMIYHHAFPLCVGGKYQFSFWYKSYTGDACLCDITVKIYDGNTLINTSSFSNISNSVWARYTSPVFTAATANLRWELYTNVSNSTCNPAGNDLCVDDVVLKNCYQLDIKNLAVCSGTSSYNLYDSISSAAITKNNTGTWNGPSALTNGYLGTFTTNTNTTGIYSYSYTPSVAGRCFSDSARFNVSSVICVAPCPKLTVNRDTTICKNLTLQLLAKLDTGTIAQINWSPTFGLSSSSIYNPIATVTKDTTYVATVIAQSPLNAIINGDFSLGNTTFSSSYTYCSASVPPVGCVQSWGLLSCPAFYTINTNPKNTHTNFSIFGDHTTGTGNMLICNGATNPNISIWCQTLTVVPNTNYQFRCWFTNVDGATTNTSGLAVFSITINNIQMGGFFRPNIAAGAWKDTIVNWNSGANTNVQICINNNSTAAGGNDFALDDISFYKVCTLTDTVKIIANIPPTIKLPRDTFLCNTINVTINPTVTGKPTPTLAWQNATTTATFNATTLGTYWCDATNVCGTKRDSMIVSLGNAPVSVSIGPYKTVCNVDSFEIVPVLNSTTPVNYKWQDSTISATYWAKTSGKYFVRAYNNCGSVWDTVTLFFKKGGSANLVAHQTICNQNSFTLTPTVSGSANLHYKWQDSTTTTTFNATSTGIYYIRVSNECGYGWDTTTLTFKQKPTVDLAHRKYFCDSLSHTLSPIVTGSANLHYKWQDSSIANTFIATRDTFYYVRVSNECGSAWDTTFLQFNFKPHFNLGKDSTICNKSTLVLAPLITGSLPMSYGWSDGGINTSTTANHNAAYFLKATNLCGSFSDTINLVFAKSPTIKFTPNQIKECFSHPVTLNPTQSGTTPLIYNWSNGTIDTILRVTQSGKYFVTVTNVCGSSTDTINVQLIPNPYLPFHGSVQTICDDSFLYLDAQNSGATFLWNTHQTDSVIKVKSQGSYVVRISNQHFCNLTDSFILKMIDCRPGVAVIPNAFTPNNDGIDDVFYPILIDNATLKSFKIFNRWGQMLFASNNKNIGWDGKYQGIEQPISTYIFVLEYYNFDKLETIKGDVSLLR